MIDDRHRREFRQTVWDYYRLHGRHDLPWRQPAPDGQFDPYHILVSEVMLQQTQVSRVVPKYQAFLTQFPTLTALAAAGQGDVVRAWSGLGYNRRARFLQQTAQAIQTLGRFPDTLDELIALPGIGAGGAGAVLAYAFNQPVVFVETNIRTALIHHFFTDQTAVPERDLLALAADTLENQQPRQWYWALTDYGAELKRSIGNLNRHSRSYTRQSKFQGSRRQVRGRVLRLLATTQLSFDELQQQISDERLPEVLTELRRENLIHQQGNRYHL